MERSLTIDQNTKAITIGYWVLFLAAVIIFGIVCYYSFTYYTDNIFVKDETGFDYIFFIDLPMMTEIGLFYGLLVSRTNSFQVHIPLHVYEFFRKLFYGTILVILLGILLAIFIFVIVIGLFIASI